MPPDEQHFGLAQEERVRAHLVSLGYTQPFGETDEEIRRNLAIKGKCADFIGYHALLDRWLIAESKGGNLDRAEAQLTNTLEALLRKEPRAIERVELQVFIRSDQYDRLLGEPPGSLALGGYHLRSKDSYLGTYDENNEWSYRDIAGLRILAVREA